ncbi:Serine/threonine-protein kinase AtPK2/AtPK19 [Phytophthora nicotianae]|uniref:Serine/threonine-protein kinase AtPK2/AtPK19 n=1 Tax=Phytophthora nicotianae TaxID=4792 RepID=A0A0W8D6I6_PHYNI|nr:Serine/threonine-protein kinase AtPK2/AtPK19 [Phytophthora nicotianae]
MTAFLERTQKLRQHIEALIRRDAVRSSLAVDERALRRRVNDFYLPMFSWTTEVVEAAQKKQGDAKRCVCIGLSCPQGGGKTTASMYMQEALALMGKKCAVMSLDDVYWKYEQQVALAKANPGNPLLQYRGNPGTMDVPLLMDLVHECKTSMGEIALPRYDKSQHNGRGNRAPVSEKATMQEALLAILRGLRNGSFYGTKVRAPHALVMIFLFQKGSIRQKLRGIVRLTFEHSKNLALFVGVYKAVLAVLRAHQEHALGRHVSTGVGKPGAHWHAAVAGGIGGYLVWGRYSSVNFQIIMYLMSRVLISAVRLLAAKGYQPFAQHRFKHVYPLLATVVWASVMWLYENEPHTLHPSLLKSMQFLYDESCRWKDGLVEFLPSPATTAVFLLTWLQF